LEQADETCCETLRVKQLANKLLRQHRDLVLVVLFARGCDRSALKDLFFMREGPQKVIEKSLVDES